MKRIYIAGLMLASCFLANCKKEEIAVYDTGHYVQFTNSNLDTISLSFFFYPNQDQVKVALPVKLVGLMPTEDLHYKIGVSGEGTTAMPAHYTLADEFVFRKGLAMDTAYVLINKRPDLATQTFTLALQIAADGDVLPGQTNYTRRIFRINDMISRPNWWNATVESTYLGRYTEKKFRTFMAVVGVGDITPYSSFEQRDLYLQFKYYLIRMKEAGTPVLEDDGTDMLSTVPLIG